MLARRSVALSTLQTHLRCRGAQRPMGRFAGRRRMRQLQHFTDLARRHRRLAPRSRGVAKQPVNSLLPIALPPAPDGRLRTPRRAHDFHGAMPVSISFSTITSRMGILCFVPGARSLPWELPRLPFDPEGSLAHGIDLCEPCREAENLEACSHRSLFCQEASRGTGSGLDSMTRWLGPTWRYMRCRGT